MKDILDPILTTYSRVSGSTPDGAKIEGGARPPFSKL